MNESPEKTKTHLPTRGAPRPEETGIPSGVSDTRNQQAPPDQQHSDASSPETENWQPTDKKPGEASPLDGEEPETPLPASAPETPATPNGSGRALLLGFMLLGPARLAAELGRLAYDFLNSPGTHPAVAPAQDVEVTVNPGTTFRTLTPELVRLGAVRNADKFNTRSAG